MHKTDNSSYSNDHKYLLTLHCIMQTRSDFDQTYKLYHNHIVYSNGPWPLNSSWRCVLSNFCPVKNLNNIWDHFWQFWSAPILWSGRIWWKWKSEIISLNPKHTIGGGWEERGGIKIQPILGLLLARWTKLELKYILEFVILHV